MSTKKDTTKNLILNKMEIERTDLQPSLLERFRVYWNGSLADADSNTTNNAKPISDTEILRLSPKDISSLHECLANVKSLTDDGFKHVSDLASEMRRVRPDFNVEKLGYKGYYQMLRDHHADEFEFAGRNVPNRRKKKTTLVRSIDKSVLREDLEQQHMSSCEEADADGWVSEGLSQRLNPEDLLFLKKEMSSCEEADTDGWVILDVWGSFIKRAEWVFKPRSNGYQGYVHLFQNYPDEFEIEFDAGLEKWKVRTRR